MGGGGNGGGAPPPPSAEAQQTQVQAPPGWDYDTEYKKAAGAQAATAGQPPSILTEETKTAPKSVLGR